MAYGIVENSSQIANSPQLEGHQQQTSCKTWRRLCVRLRYVLGVYIMNLGGNIPWIWGNLSLYTSSFVYAKLDDTTGASAPWILALYFIGWCLGLLTRDTLCKYVHRKYVLAVFVLVASASMCLSTFTIKSSVPAFNLTLGLIPGYCSGVIFSLQLVFIVELIDRNLSFFVSGVSSCILVFGFITNELITFYVNPKNNVPDDNMGELQIFTNKEIINRVPDVFLYLSLTSIVCSFLGMVLLGKKTEHPESFLMIESNGHNTSNMDNDNVLKLTETLKDDFKHDDKEIESNKQDDTKVESNKQDYIELQSSFKKAKDSEKQCVIDSNTTSKDFTPKEVMKTYAFYVMCAVSIVVDTAMIALSSYYKTFGIIQIQDDHFMTNVGTCLALFVGVFTFISGALVDRFGVKNCLVGHLSLLTIVLALYPFTIRINRWLFFITTMTYGCLSYPCYTIVTTAMLILFGNTYYTTHLGMVIMATVPLNCVLPLILETIVDHFSFVGLFFFLGSITLIVCIVVVVFLKTD